MASSRTSTAHKRCGFYSFVGTFEKLQCSNIMRSPKLSAEMLSGGGCWNAKPIKIQSKPFLVIASNVDGKVAHRFRLKCFLFHTTLSANVQYNASP